MNCPCGAPLRRDGLCAICTHGPEACIEESNCKQQLADNGGDWELLAMEARGRSW